MKKIILLIIFLSLFMTIKIEVQAEVYTDRIYTAKELEGITYAKEKNGEITPRKAKMIKRESDNQIVYCLEPFVLLEEYADYKGYDFSQDKLLKISKEQWKRVNLLSYYGYGYKDHNDEKWYSITQILIWRTVDKTADFYWTDSYKGKRVDKYLTEIEELEQLIRNHDIKPSFDSDTFDMSIYSSLAITDSNNVLSSYEIINDDEVNAKISGNKLIITSDNVEKNINIRLIKRDRDHHALPIVYISTSSQAVISVGSYDSVYSNLNVSINSGEIKILKLDEDTNSTVPQGEGQLIGAVYEVYTEDNQLVGNIVIDQNNMGSLKKLKYGKYKIKEKTSGIGYKIDPKEYTVEVNSKNKTIEVKLTNEVIKRKIRIQKYFAADDDKKLVEKNITFQIFDKDGNLFKEVTTNEYGIIELELPFGSYIVKQLNTTDGYAKVEDFIINVNDDSNDIIEYFLNDLKLPNTYQSNNLFLPIAIILNLIFLLKYYEKKYC